MMEGLTGLAAIDELNTANLDDAITGGWIQSSGFGI